ncbi:MAG: MarR family transcriptional regulator [Boseongicola sp.]|nr:MarR family transcriptional regulator [Boseongicola sp.]
MDKSDFDLRDFMPYLLNMAAEEASLEFQQYYKGRYGMLRTEWRVLFHLGRYGEMTAKTICDRARIHKTKVSRAVSALEQKRFLSRKEVEEDRRHELLRLTNNGVSAYNDISAKAKEFDEKLVRPFSVEEQSILRQCLIKLANL